MVQSWGLVSLLIQLTPELFYINHELSAKHTVWLWNCHSCVVKVVKSCCLQLLKLFLTLETTEVDRTFITKQTGELSCLEPLFEALKSTDSLQSRLVIVRSRLAVSQERFVDVMNCLQEDLESLFRILADSDWLEGFIGVQFFNQKPYSFWGWISLELALQQFHKVEYSDLCVERRNYF